MRLFGSMISMTENQKTKINDKQIILYFITTILLLSVNLLINKINKKILILKLIYI